MGFWSRLRKTFRGEAYSAELEEELQFHLDMDTAQGRNPREARLRLGNRTRIAEETRSMGTIEWLHSAFQDARYGLRQVRKTPALVLAVVLSLAIGVGANTAIFSLVDAALLKPLPVDKPDALRIVEWTNNAFPKGVTNINGSFRKIAEGRVQGSSVSAILHRRLAEKQSTYAALVGIADPNGVAVALDASPAEQLSLQYVSANFFQGVGANPVIGRGFQDEEDRVGHEPVLVVSHRYWVSKLGANPDALRRSIMVNHVPARIVGVAPPGFFGLRAGQWTDIYAPLAARVALRPGGRSDGARGEDDGDWWVRQLVRLKPGTAEDVARMQITGLFRELAAGELSAAGSNEIPELITLEGRRGFDALGAKDANALWILLLLVGVLLLIVCANVANLLLSRSIGRLRECSVRLALGASQGRIFRQHLIESGVLAVLGGAAGLALGYALAHSIHHLFQTGRDVSSTFDLHLDLRVFGFTGALSIVSAFLFGLAPAARAARVGLSDALKAQTRSLVGGQLRLPRLLVSFQIALCLTALMAGGLLLRSLEALKLTDLGFDRENLAYASVNPEQAGYRPEQLKSYVDRVRDELSRLPEVLHVSTTNIRLLSGNANAARMSIPGRASVTETGIVNPEEMALLNSAGPGFFETMRIPLIAGRAFAAGDFEADASAVIVDELFARHFFPNESAIGRRFGFNPQENTRFEIVGVVGNTAYNSLRNDAIPTLYQPYQPKGAIHFAIRSSVDSARLAESVRRAVAAVDPAVPVSEFHTQTGLIDRLLRTERLLGFLSGAFALVALALAAIGLGGLLAYAVARRTNEIGLRMALGAAANDVVTLVLKDSLRMLTIGIVVGVPCAYVVGTVLKSSLFRLHPFDSLTLGLALSALFAVAILAAWVPATRAAKINPTQALREE